MADAILVIILLFVGFLVLAGIIIAAYFIYKDLNGDPNPDSSIQFKPGDTISIRPSWFEQAGITGTDVVKNTTKYIVAGGNLCNQDGAISTSPTNSSCQNVNWIYNTDLSLSPAGRPNFFIYDVGTGNSCGRQNLNLSDKSTDTPLKWTYDRKRWTWCVTGGEKNGMCMQIATSSFGTPHQGITLTTLPTNFDTLKTDDKTKARFQFTVENPLSPSTNPSCINVTPPNVNPTPGDGKVYSIQSIDHPTFFLYLSDNQENVLITNDSDISCNNINWIYNGGVEKNKTISPLGFPNLFLGNTSGRGEGRGVINVVSDVSTAAKLDYNPTNNTICQTGTTSCFKTLDPAATIIGVKYDTASNPISNNFKWQFKAQIFPSTNGVTCIS